jgi:hypothetical protein
MKHEMLLSNTDDRCFAPRAEKSRTAEHGHATAGGDVADHTNYTPAERIRLGTDWPSAGGMRQRRDPFANVNLLSTASRERVMRGNARELTFAAPGQYLSDRLRPSRIVEPRSMRSDEW